MHEVNFRFTVQGSDTEQEAIEMAADYFCGGDFYQQVTQHEPEAHEVREVTSQPEATAT